jgi:hypothetical protein
MRILTTLFILVSLTAQHLYAQNAQTALVKIAVPSGFEGPTSASENGADVVGYVRRIPGSTHGTLLQISTYDFGAKLKGIPKKDLGDGAEHYLLQFLSGVERRRTNFHASSPTRQSLGGIPAARIEWTGIAQGQQMSGVMYCVIVGTKVVAFHTQGFASSPPSDRANALRAIESAKFHPGG